MLELSMYMEHNMKIVEKIFDVQTGEESIVERDETTAEKKIREKRESEIAARQAELEAKTAARQAIADRLGLTADELQVLLG
jgi:hypothetical protein